jgi:hypothetical protein
LRSEYNSDRNPALRDGVYFYTLTSGIFKETKRMLLIK